MASSTVSSHSRLHKLSLAGMLVTVGIVFGDIGTSPLYVMKAIVGASPDYQPDYIIGAVSCVIWTLTLQTTVKYVLLALRADNRGEGGILALFALLRRLPRKWLPVVAAIGAAALVADGMITPAITVSSAVEGLSLVVSDVPVLMIVVVIIITVFVMQQAGTSRIGRFFGPFMLLWFLSLGVLGALSIKLSPDILKAFNPWYAVKLLISSPQWFLILGAVFLCTTGAEALYSDLGHCGRKNITVSWLFVKAMLILNYLGQGAWLISTGMGESVNPFYAIVPHGLEIPAVIMATLAAVIASQALLSGSFTIFSEAVGLDFWPSLKVKYPSAERGQLYIPAVNWSLLAGCLLTVAIFRDSSHMEAAYGLSITIAMIMTTVLLAIWLRVRRVAAVWCILFFGFFTALEGLFFVANLAKFTHGGWYSILIGGVIAAIMIVWMKSTALRSKYIDYKPLGESIALISDISEDCSIPKYASNLVYLSRSSNPAMIESKVLYSIINRQPKRADHYWFVHISHDDAPDTLGYSVVTIEPRKVFVITMHLGFKVTPRINVYLRQVVEDLVAKGNVDLVSTYPSLRRRGIPGDFRFIILHRVFSPSSSCSRREASLLRLHDRLRHLGISDTEALGLDTSVVTLESVPLILTTTPTQRIMPI